MIFNVFYTLEFELRVPTVNCYLYVLLDKLSRSRRYRNSCVERRAKVAFIRIVCVLHINDSQAYAELSTSCFHLQLERPSLIAFLVIAMAFQASNMPDWVRGRLLHLRRSV
jgi:hypothetical protein